MLGDTVEARALRLDSLGWARYGFGAEAEVRARLTEIAVLSPASGRLSGAGAGGLGPAERRNGWSFLRRWCSAR